VIRWSYRSVAAWIGIGFVVGPVSVAVVAAILASAMELDSPDVEGELGFFVAGVFSPIVGALWGFLAGSIGVSVVAVSRSARAYSFFMGISAIAPFVPFVTEQAAAIVAAIATGVGIWLIARRSTLQSFVAVEEKRALRRTDWQRHHARRKGASDAPPRRRRCPPNVVGPLRHADLFAWSNASTGLTRHSVPAGNCPIAPAGPPSAEPGPKQSQSEGTSSSHTQPEAKKEGPRYMGSSGPV
jgi:hypothetical protein